MRALIINGEETELGSDAIYQFQRVLVHAGDECLFRQLGATWDPAASVADAADFDLCVAAGGDYVVSRLLHALAGSALPVCVFPTGYVNLFFGALGNAAEPFALARACRFGRTIDADLAEIHWVDEEGRAHREGFSLMAGSGFDAELMRAGASNRSAMGQSAYLVAALANPNPTRSHFTIELDGRTVERDGIACIVANTAVIQGDIEIVPDCSMTDGELDVIVLEAPDTVGLIKPVLFGFLDPSGKNLGRPEIEGFKARSVKVSSSVPMPLQVDGETGEVEVRGFEARVLPGAVRLIVDPMSPYYAQAEATSPRFSGTEERKFL